jgi:hypothetical protein
MFSRPTPSEPFSKLLTESEQDAEVLEVYATIADQIRELNEHITTFQPLQDDLKRKFDAYPGTEEQKSQLRDSSTQFQGLLKLLAQLRWQITTLEDYQKVYKLGWDEEKKRTVEKRQVFLERKFKEYQGLDEVFRSELKEVSNDAGVQLVDKDETDTGNVSERTG